MSVCALFFFFFSLLFSLAHYSSSIHPVSVCVNVVVAAREEDTIYDDEDDVDLWCDGHDDHQRTLLCCVNATARKCFYPIRVANKNWFQLVVLTCRIPCGGFVERCVPPLRRADERIRRERARVMYVCYYRSFRVVNVTAVHFWAFAIDAFGLHAIGINTNCVNFKSTGFRFEYFWNRILSSIPWTVSSCFYFENCNLIFVVHFPSTRLVFQNLSIKNPDSRV